MWLIINWLEFICMDEEIGNKQAYSVTPCIWVLHLLWWVRLLHSAAGRPPLCLLPVCDQGTPQWLLCSFVLARWARPFAHLSRKWAMWLSHSMSQRVYTLERRLLCLSGVTHPDKCIISSMLWHKFRRGRAAGVYWSKKNCPADKLKKVISPLPRVVLSSPLNGMALCHLPFPLRWMLACSPGLA